MNKSMYSLILIDDVVRKVDELAYQRGTSRSNLVNQILADYVSLLTPQKRIEEIFGQLAQAAQGEGVLQVQQPSASMLLLKSVLNYRYNPTIRYSVEITVEQDRYLCEFKVVSRTQSDALLSRLTVFYELWTQIEHSNLRGKLDGELRFAVDKGRFKRWLLVEDSGGIRDSRQLGQAIGRYIRLFDKALKLSFDAEHGMDMETFERMNALYEQYLQECEVIV